MCLIELGPLSAFPLMQFHPVKLISDNWRERRISVKVPHGSPKLILYRGMPILTTTLPMSSNSFEIMVWKWNGSSLGWEMCRAYGIKPGNGDKAFSWADLHCLGWPQSAVGCPEKDGVRLYDFPVMFSKRLVIRSNCREFGLFGFWIFFFFNWKQLKLSSLHPASLQTRFWKESQEARK